MRDFGVFAVCGLAVAAVVVGLPRELAIAVLAFAAGLILRRRAA